MSYGIELRPGLNDEFMQQPPAVQRSIQAALLRLADAPTESRPSRLPYPPGYQMYRFEHEDPGAKRRGFVILFKYSQDERKLWIAGVVPA
jgi:hypothetical protein